MNAPEQTTAAVSKPHASVRRTGRWLGRAMVAGVWATLLALLGYFGLCFAIYRDLRAPEQSRLVAGTRFEPLARLVFELNFWPIWQQDPACAQFDPQLVYVPKPGFAPFRGLEFATAITMTPEGLRRQPGPPPVATAPAIVLTGDSYTMGWGVNDRETFSGILAEKFGHATINSGVPSYGTARELLRLRRLGLLERAAVLVIQYSPNDAPENTGFVLGPPSRADRTAQQEQWQKIQTRRGAVTTDVTFARVVRGVSGAGRALIEQWGFRQFAADLLAGQIRVARPYHQTYRNTVGAFLRVLDHFPELNGKTIIVVELKPPHEESDFIATLAERAGDRPNIHVLPLRLEPADYYRFDSHLRSQGHEKVAAQLDAALRRWQPSAPARP